MQYDLSSRVLPTNIAYLLKLRNWNQAQLAQKLGLSRQAVSKWLQADFKTSPKVSLNSMLKLCELLNIGWNDLSKPLFEGDEVEWKKRLRVSLLWDHLYSDVDEFLLALYFFEPRAVARYVQVYGLYQSANTLGDRVWKDFDLYKNYLHPVRRNECEKICQIHQQLITN